jgi:hypothetical protein
MEWRKHETDAYLVDTCPDGRGIDLDLDSEGTQDIRAPGHSGDSDVPMLCDRESGRSHNERRCR